MLFKISVLKNSVIFTLKKKKLALESLLNKVGGLKPVTISKRHCSTSVFLKSNSGGCFYLLKVN